MAGKKSRGSWDSYDGRTKAGKSKSTYHPHRDADAFVDMMGSLFSKGAGALKSKGKKTGSINDPVIHSNELDEVTIAKKVAQIETPEEKEQWRRYFDCARKLEEDEWKELWKILKGTNKNDGTGIRGWWD